MAAVKYGEFSGQGGQMQRLYEMRRRVFMGTVLLVSLLCFKAVLLSTAGPSTPLWYRVLNYTISAYALVLLLYTSFWLWQTLRRRQPESQSSTDPLTGLMDWDGLVETVHEDNLDSPSSQPVRLVYVDMVGLKQVNAVCGQNIGDSVLQEAAKILRAATPSEARLARLKGDEFVVLLQETTPEKAERIRQRIVKRIETHNFGTGDAGVSCRATVLPQLSGDCRLVELLAGVRRGGTIKGDADEHMTDAEYCAIPQVTISACARYRLDSLNSPLRNGYYQWRRGGDHEFLNRMAREVQEVISLQAGGRPFDFVTAPPGKESSQDNKPAHALARQVARELDVPYRKVLRAGPVSRAFDWMEPKVATAVKEDSHVLLVSDCVEEGSHTRRCVEKLAQAGAFVQVVAWAARV